MLTNILTHFLLTIRLFRDKNVSIWLKILTIGIPVTYAIAPITYEIPDFIPITQVIFCKSAQAIPIIS